MAEPPAGTEWRYTLDGTEPTMASPRYTAPVQLQLPAQATDEGAVDDSPQLWLRLRVVAYPAMVAPSEELAIDLTVQPTPAAPFFAAPSVTDPQSESLFVT